MTRKQKVFVIAGIICVFIAFVIIYSSDVIGVFSNNIESDARKSQKVSSWEVCKSINNNLCAMIFYDEALDHHIFSIYVNRKGFSLGYFFVTGGSNSVVTDGINEFAFDIYGSGIISMNTDNVARIELDNDIEITRIDVDPAKPFAVVIPINCGSVTLYDVNENIVPITVTQEGL